MDDLRKSVHVHGVYLNCAKWAQPPCLAISRDTLFGNSFTDLSASVGATATRLTPYYYKAFNANFLSEPATAHMKGRSRGSFAPRGKPLPVQRRPSSKKSDSRQGPPGRGQPGLDKKSRFTFINKLT